MRPEELLDKVLNENLVELVISNPRKKDKITKIKVRPVILKGQLFFQETDTAGKQELHSNLSREDIMDRVMQIMAEDFKQCQILTKTGNGVILSGKSGTMTAKYKETGVAIKEQRQLSHNKTKKYLIAEGQPVPFLCDLGVMDRQGRVNPSRYDKFRQVNRYLEFIDDVLAQLDSGRQQTIIDFGCGKSYLTFAMYYYLNEVKGMDVRIIGLDLKEDVINNCSSLAKKYGYDKLEFLVGDIASYNGVDEVDMVVSLHACDVATDYAIAKAVNWGARVILAVPCCQHEANGKIANEMMEPVLSYGILKERMAAIMTDAVRAGIMESCGYRTQILEFIDMEHTPKNLLIRAVYTGKCDKVKQEAVLNMEKEFNLSLTLNKLLNRRQ
ncbi:MAG: class I SAM-dependent methyltransferase [Lachnospiraceae bacterium]